MTYEAYFDDGANAGSWVYFEREYDAPGTAEFNYKVDNSKIFGSLNTWGSTYVDDWFRGTYVKTPAELYYSEDVLASRAALHHVIAEGPPERAALLVVDA